MQILKFKGYCAERKITQSELAKVLGLSVQSINKKLNGKEDFSLPQIRVICQTYGINADDYFI